jgi:hypothetical protein
MPPLRRVIVVRHHVFTDWYLLDALISAGFVQ